MLFAASSEEQEILEKVFQHSGQRWRKIGGIPTDEASVAAMVLPILADLVDFDKSRDIRGAILHRFHTRHAKPFLDRILDWWAQEPDHLNRQGLGAGLALLPDNKTARRLWEFCEANLPEPTLLPLVARLCKFPSVGGSAKNYLVSELSNPSLERSALNYIANVDDPRVTAWFLDRRNSADPFIRALAGRIARRHSRGGQPTTPGVLSRTCPPRGDEVFSTEIDRAHLAQVLEELGSRFGFGRMEVEVIDNTLDRMEGNAWLVVDPTAEPKTEKLRVWFRLEDIDTVEIVVTRPVVPAGRNERAN